MTRSVAVLGTGIMGAPMARNLARAGLEVRAWNRTRAKAEPLAADGVTVAGTPAEAAAGADAVLTMLADGDAVEQAMAGPDGALAVLAPGLLWIQSATVGVEAAERLGRLAAERSVVYVDAPVLGTKQPAEEGKLVMLASGPESAREACAPIFEAVGQRTTWLGEAGLGTRLKLVVNNWIISAVEGIAETFALAAALGLDGSLFLETIKGGGVDIAYAHAKGGQILARDFPPSFPLRLAEKDARLVLEAAAATGLELALTRTVRSQMQRAIALGHGDEDMIATYFATVEGRT